MTYRNLISYVGAKVDKYQKEYKISIGQSFTLWYAIEGLDMNLDDAYEAISYDGANDKNIDLFYVDEDYERVVIIQGKYNSKGVYKPKVGQFLELIHSTDWLQDTESLVREGRADLANASKEYCNAIEKGYSVEFQFVYMGTNSRPLIDQAKHFNSSESGTVPSRSARVVSIDLLQLSHDEHIGKSTRIESDSLKISTSSMFEQEGSFGKALVATVLGKELYRLYGKHRDALFDRNVRLFLGARKGSVNAGMRETLESITDRKNFWAYNNGMTFICDKYSIDKRKGNLTLQNFSIVNGCQTTVSIANAPKDAIDDVYILARFIASPEESVIDEVITYTNRQNPVQLWDISAQDKNQKKLKRLLAEDPYPYYYILKKGEQTQLKTAERKKFTREGKLQAVRLDMLGQYLGSFNGLPTIAYKDKSKLFSTHRDTVFPSDLTPEQSILALRSGEAAEIVVRKMIAESTERDDKESLQILKRGGKLFVLAIMAVLLKERNGAPYIGRLKRDVVGSKHMLERLSKYATLSAVWYIETLKDMLEAGSDLSQIVRSQDNFIKIKDKILTKWRVQSLSKSWLKDAVPKIAT